MTILFTIGLILGATIISIGIYRVITSPYTGVLDFLLDLFLLDLLIDLLFAIFKLILEIWE